MAEDGLESRELLDRARAGDAEAFAQLFESQRAVLHRVAYRLVGSASCDDVVMESYLKAWRALPQFKGHCALRTWLCRIANNCALDLLRQQNRREVSIQSADEPDAQPLLERIADAAATAPDRAADLHDLGGAIDAALTQLSAEHRAALLLREVDGLSYQEVAAATGASIGTVMSRLFYARRRMRRILEASGVCAG